MGWKQVDYKERRRALGAELKRLRLAAKVTQMEIARELGYSNGQFISNWERGVASPPESALGTIAKALKIKPRRLVELVIAVEEQELAERKQRLLGEVC